LKLWQQATQTGAALLWRVGSTVMTPVIAELADGSYLIFIPPQASPLESSSTTFRIGPATVRTRTL
jgi:hypothetical protein